jgi:prevent-host-death family protein
MPSIGMRELKNHANEILRSVREERAEYVITYHGEPVALLLPIERQSVDESERAQFYSIRPSEGTEEELEALRAEIERSWKSKKTAAQLIKEGRR